MVGAGEQYLAPFAVFLKANNLQIGFISAIPPIFGAIFQLLSVKFLYFLKSRKKIVLWSVRGQAMTWPFILSIPFFMDRHALPVFIVAVTVYFALGSFAHPSWRSMMGDFVDADRRGGYFGFRSRWMSLMTFSAFCLAGFILHHAEQNAITIFGFSVIFALAFLARLISAAVISKITEPEFASHSKDYFSFLQFIRKGRGSNFGQFVVYTALIHFSVNLSGPFITPYLLRDLQFSYLKFMVCSSAVVLAQYLTLRFWGRCADYFGNKKMLHITGMMLAIIPCLWVFTQNFISIVGIQLFAGVAWGGFALSMENFIYDAVSPQKRPQCVAIFTCCNAIGILCGSLGGGMLSQHLPSVFTIGTIHLSLVSNLYPIFILSALLRLMVTFYRMPHIQEERSVHPLTLRGVWKIIRFKK